MGHSIQLQSWETIRGSTGTAWVQDVGSAADLEHDKDLLVVFEVADFSNVTIAFQTSPTKDANLFTDMGTIAVPSAGVFSIANLYATATVPIARYVRWRAGPTAAGAWSITIRIWLAPNMSGNARRRLPGHKESMEAHLKMHEEHAKRMAEAGKSG